MLGFSDLMNVIETTQIVDKAFNKFDNEKQRTNYINSQLTKSGLK